MMLQPTPPAPTPFDPFVFGRIQEGVVIIVIAVALAFVAIKVLGPMARAMARRLEGGAVSPELRAEIDQLRAEVAEADHLKSRVQELEERVEFAERMLSKGRDQDLLRRGGEG